MRQLSDTQRMLHSDSTSARALYGYVSHASYDLANTLFENEKTGKTPNCTATGGVGKLLTSHETPRATATIYFVQMAKSQVC
jgi:hypothetical protein